MSTLVNGLSLTGHIALVEKELATVPPWSQLDIEVTREERRAAIQAAVQRLRDSTGGKIDDRPNWEASRVRIFGIQSTCTAGIEGALRNWLVAARKRLAP